MKTTKMSIKSIALVWIIGFSLMFFWGCQKNFDCNYIEGSGNVVSETRNVGTFHNIHLNLAARITIQKGAAPDIEIQAEDNIMPYIITRVQNGTLYIDADQSISTHETIRFVVYMDDIRELFIDGSGKITTTEQMDVNNLNIQIDGSGRLDLAINANSVFTNIRGSGDINLQGNAQNLTLKIDGSGEINAENLHTANCYITINGSGKCYVHVTGILDAVIAGSGVIYYRGNPDTINTSISGSGKIQQF